MSTWPADLPQSPLINGFKDRLPALTVRSQPDVGPAKVRRRFTSAVRPMTFNFLMTSEQLTSFETFFIETLQGGALAFDFVHPRTEETISLRFLQEPPEPEAVSDDLYRVVCMVERLP